MCAGVVVLLLAATASAQLPSLDAFLAEPLHTVRRRLENALGRPVDGLGVELTMPASVDVGSFSTPDHFFRPADRGMPLVRVFLAIDADDLDAWIGPAVESRYELGEGATNIASAGTITRGDEWAARVYTVTEVTPGSRVVRSVVHVAMWVAPRDRGVLCFGTHDDVEAASVDRVRDWLLARCRSVRVMAVP